MATEAMLVEAAAAEDRPAEPETHNSGDKIAQNADILHLDPKGLEVRVSGDHHRASYDDRRNHNRKSHAIARTVDLLEESVQVFVPDPELPSLGSKPAE